MDPEREVMAALLSTNAELVADVLRGADEPGSDSAMRAIAATRSLSVIVDDTLRSLVDRARAEGRTWAEIGQVLHVSRQAAFQRFGGGAPRRHADDEKEMMTVVENAPELALAVVEHFLAEEWKRTRADFDERMLEACPPELLASVRERVRAGGGEFLEFGSPDVSVRGGYTVVEIPLAFARGDAVSQVTFNADRQVAGFFIHRADA
jgi:hypothetical protein